jgi:hypothetical protein
MHCTPRLLRLLAALAAMALVVGEGLAATEAEPKRVLTVQFVRTGACPLRFGDLAAPILLAEAKAARATPPPKGNVPTPRATG